MEVVFPYCAGREVHKKRVTACRLGSDSAGQIPEGVADLQTFGTRTHALLALADWLVEAGVTHVAMESTGEYWKPVSNARGLNPAGPGRRPDQGPVATSAA